MRGLRRLARCISVAAAAAMPAQAARPAPFLACKPDAQQSCTPAGCRAEEPVTQAEIGIDLRDGRTSLCYGTACWRTGWSRLERAAPGRLAASLSGTARINGKGERLWLQTTVDTAGLRFEATVAEGSGAVQVFFGSCVCRNAAPGDGGCAKAAR